VSNFDVRDIENLIAVSGGDRVQTLQVRYNRARRRPHDGLLPRGRKARMPVMPTPLSTTAG
jgi:diketogulonate reductase-like aldo/keto reductase